MFRFSGFVSGFFIQLMLFMKHFNEINGVTVTNICGIIVNFWILPNIIQSCFDLTKEVHTFTFTTFIHNTIYLLRNRV